MSRKKKQPDSVILVEELNEDREYIESLVGYASLESWHIYDNECPADSDIECDEEDLDSFAPDGSPIMPSVRFYSEYGMSKYEDDIWEL